MTEILSVNNKTGRIQRTSKLIYLYIMVIRGGIHEMD